MAKLLPVNNVFELADPEDDLHDDDYDVLGWLNGEFLTLKGVSSVSRPTQTSLAVTGSYLPTWCAWLAVLLFPIGLLFLMHRPQYTFQVEVRAHRGGDQLRIVGTAPELVCAQLRAVQFVLLAIDS